MKYVQPGYRDQTDKNESLLRARQRGERPGTGAKQPFVKVHIKKGKKALCNNQGFLKLVSKDEFERTNPADRCGKCEILSGLRTRANEIDTLSERQKQLLRKIYEKTDNGAAGKWCLTMYLCRDNYRAGSTSLYRSLRRLQARGCIEQKQNEQKRSIVRLTARVHVLDSSRIVILNKTGPAGQADGR